MISKLNLYNQKRDFDKTDEPTGEMKKSDRKLKFVVQHHVASRDHFDFRLELNGTLKSWAIPKGPSYNPEDKRLAVEVEDHPISYRNFEGTIPKGQYGGGTVMIWDEGYWEALGDPDEDFNNGSAKFILKGKRLKGKWSLIKLKKEINGKENNWLLIKEKDDFSKKAFNINKFNTSIITGRTMLEIEEGKKKKIDNSVFKKTKQIILNDSVIEEIEISNPDKVVFDKPKITKKDVALYYQKVSLRMIPFLENRIISTIRCPGGVNESCFFKKHPDNNKGITRINIKNSKGEKEEYYYVSDVLGLISEVQMNTIEFHIWGSRIENLEKPDIMVFDLDPDERLNLKNVRQGAKDLKSILDELSLVSFLKTSGGKGYHVVVPTKPSANWESFRDFAKNIARIMELKWPDRYLSNVRKSKRKGKVFVDWIRNTRSSTSVAPYSIRIKKNATVSMPISWRELDKIAPNEITLDKAIKRLRRKDPWDGFFQINQQIK